MTDRAPWVVICGADHPQPELRKHLHCQRCGELAMAPWGSSVKTFVAMTEAFRHCHRHCRPAPVD